MAGTIPADIVQFYWHALVLAQKLAYLYGWLDLLNEGQVDEETEFRLTLLIGAMMGSQPARRGLVEVAERLAKEVAHRLRRQALTKQVARWVGIKITTTAFSRGISKVIPIVGAVVSASLTASMMFPMAKRLKNHLRELRLAKPQAI